MGGPGTSRHQDEPATQPEAADVLGWDRRGTGRAGPPRGTAGRAEIASKIPRGPLGNEALLLSVRLFYLTSS